MELHNIRIGNDVPISFFVDINDGGTPLSTDDTTIFLWDPNGNPVDIQWSISGNQVSGTYLGAAQKYTGIYTLKVVLNKGAAGMATSDRQMFRLVPHTWQGDTDPGSLDGFTIRLTDVISVGEMEELRELLGTEFPALKERVQAIEDNVAPAEDTTEVVGEAFAGTAITQESLQKLTQLKDIVLAAQAAKIYADGINMALSERLSRLSNALDTLVGTGDVTQAIDTFQEVVAFLNGISGTTLDALLTSIHEITNSLAQTKQDVIEDLSTIRSGAAAGATAYQKPQTGIPTSDLTSAIQSLLTAAGTALQPEDIAQLTQKVAALESLVSEDDNPTQAIDKFQEIVAFLNGISGTTLDALLTSIHEITNSLAQTKQDAIEDLSAIRSGAAAGATAYQKPQTGIPTSDLTNSVRQALDAANTSLQFEENNDPASLFADSSE